MLLRLARLDRSASGAGYGELPESLERFHRNSKIIYFPCVFLFPLCPNPTPGIRSSVAWRALASFRDRCAEQETHLEPTTESGREQRQTHHHHHRKRCCTAGIVSNIQRTVLSLKQLLPGGLFFPLSFLFLCLQLCYETCGSTRKEQTWAGCRGAEGNIRRSIYSKRHFNNSTFSSFLAQCVWHSTNENAIASCCLVLDKR